MPPSPSSLKVALDVDGVITKAPEFFATLTAALRQAGHEVYILTDHDETLREAREEELAGWGVEYDCLVITRRKQAFFEDLEMDVALDDEAAAYFPRHPVAQIGLVSRSTSSV
jgi:ribonucleotide monophosphatase NagD (HAD superfamily)